MINENQNIDNQVKVEQIISAAQSVFGRFGMKKATMQEIASEIGISKALLYYYFPDKEHLYKTVVEKEHHEFITALKFELSRINDTENKLKEFVSIRMMYFRKLLTLSRFRMEDYSGIKTIMENVWNDCRNKELEVINEILSEGKEKQIFHIKNTLEIADIFLDLLKGLSHIMIKTKQIFYLESEEFDTLIERAMSFVDIFTRGLKHN